MARPRLLYVATEDWYFISDTLPLARAALAAGFDVHVAARANGTEDRIRAAGLTYHPLTRISRSGTGAVSEALSIKELRALYGEFKPDIAHHIALKPIIYGAAAARGRPTIATVNSVMGLGYVFTSASPKARLLRPLMAAALRAAFARARSRTILQNNDDLEAVAALSPAARPNLRLVRGSGVDIEKFAPQTTPQGPPVIVLPARLLRDKGVGEFVEAARILKEKGVTARFALVGVPDADNPASVSRAEIAAWVSAGLIEHWGFRTDMPEVYRAANIVCLPSYREGLPRVLLEAAATGRALVTCDTPGCREVVRHGVNGWLVPPRDSNALAGALAEAIADPERCVRYGAAGRNIVEQEFAAGIVIAETLAIYRELLTGHPNAATTA